MTTKNKNTAPAVKLTARSFPLYSKSRGKMPAPSVWQNGTALEHLGECSGLKLTTFAAAGYTVSSEGVDAQRARLVVKNKKGEALAYVSLLVSQGGSQAAYLMRRYSMADVEKMSEEQRQMVALVEVFRSFKDKAVSLEVWEDVGNPGAWLAKKWNKWVEKGNAPTFLNETGTGCQGWEKGIIPSGQIADAIQTVLDESDE